ncbi:hypothetical protein ABZ078_44015 [Streptomyces sp. NPDC006385]|uniref:hypothetical protein n=1 Tax=Streptomyces sp. NPDC006385 TaxID=3156761 RepID=UPI0033BA1C46
MRRQRLSHGRARMGSTRVLGVLLLVLALLGCASGASAAAGMTMAEPCAGGSAEAMVMAVAPDGTSSAAKHSCTSDHDRCPASRTESVPHTHVPGTDGDLPTGPPPTAASLGAARAWEHARGPGDPYALCVIRT